MAKGNGDRIGGLRRALLVLLGALLIAGLMACGRGRGGSPGGAGNAGVGAVLRYPMTAQVSSFDPTTITDTETLELLQNIFEGLVAWDEKNAVVPALAEKWEISPDGKTYTFHLHPKATFHNGRAVTSADVKYSFERALWPETKSPVAANYLDGIVGTADVAAGKSRVLAGVTTPDPHTVVFQLRRPRGYFLGELTCPPAWVVCREAIEKNGGRLDERSAVGAGPFRLEEYRAGAKVTLAAHTGYHAGRPPLDRVERPIVIDLQTARIMYEEGRLDICPQPFSDYVNDRQSPKFRDQVQFFPHANVMYLLMSYGQKPFNDPRVRQAIARAIDRDAIAANAYKGVCPRADGLLPPGLPGYDPNRPKIPYDPAEAKRLLAAAGFPDGKGFPQLPLVYVEKDPQIAAMAGMIQSDLKRNLGIEISLNEHESATFYADARAHKLPFHLNGWVADYLDPQNFLPTLLHTGAAVNRVEYHNPAFDALCDRADAETDSAKRLALYQQADRMAMADVALLPMVHAGEAYLVKPRVHDLKSSLIYFLPHRKTRVDP